jgi:hypothetical protein
MLGSLLEHSIARVLHCICHFRHSAVQEQALRHISYCTDLYRTSKRCPFGVLEDRMLKQWQPRVLGLLQNNKVLQQDDTEVLEQLQKLKRKGFVGKLLEEGKEVGF